MKIKKITSEQFELLEGLSQEYIVDNWDFPKWTHGKISNLKFDSNSNLFKTLSKFNNDLENSGYLLFDFSDNLKTKGITQEATFISFFVALFGEPIKIFDNLNTHWRKIGVNLLKNPNKSEGVGESPLHMDFVNASNPPDFVCLYVIRPDTGGGGASTLADFSKVENFISKNSLEELKKSQFIDGKVENLSNIGDDINPFAIISEHSQWKFRITGNLLFSNESGPKVDAVRELFKEINKNKISHKLNSKQLLIINQRIMLHGKEPLAQNQEDILTENHRLLMHGFLRKK